MSRSPTTGRKPIATGGVDAVAPDHQLLPRRPGPHLVEDIDLVAVPWKGGSARRIGWDHPIQAGPGKVTRHDGGVVMEIAEQRVGQLQGVWRDLIVVRVGENEFPGRACRERLEDRPQRLEIVRFSPPGRPREEPRRRATAARGRPDW